MSGTKVKKLGSLKKLIRALKARGKKIVFTNGCFDILHYGHVMYLEKAKAKGDCLVVAINSDSSVRKIKGLGRPVVNEFDRARVLAGLQSVDFVVVFGEKTPLKIIQVLEPDILVKGSDWKGRGIVGADFVKSYGGRVKTVKLAKDRSTTNLIKKIAKTN
ncbi:MAG: D-glycero-beta-D-manno-heptose 1-phosphate adenylyltransferase [Candidatus Omnitrophota bacterium]